MIIAGDDLDYGEAGSGDEDDDEDDGGGAGGEHQVLVVGDIHLKEEEEEDEMVEGLQEMLEEQVVLEEGVQYEIELA